MSGDASANSRQTAVSASHYGRSYETKQRLASFWHQVDEVLKLRPREVLEIGTGSGHTTRVLRTCVPHVITLDVAPDLNPDVLGTVQALPLADSAVDVVLCCQVLEHLPFAEFGAAVRELWRVARRGVVLSLPDGERHLRWLITIGSRQTQRFIDLPRRPSRRPTTIDPQHHWEIGRGAVGLSDVLKVIGSMTGVSPHTFRVFENPYHRFFVLHKT